jgi:capsid protein
MTLYDLRGYFEAELVRKRIESCLSVFVTTDPDAVDDGTAAIGLPSTVDATRRERLAPGIISYLRPGEDVSTAVPASGGGIGEFSRVQLQASAAAAGVMYEQVTGDFSGTNYSSYRAGNFDFRRMVSRHQWLTITPMLLAPVTQAFARHALISGLAPGNTLPRWSHEMPEFISVDPKKDAEADALNMRMGKVRPSQLIGRTGYNFEEHLEGWAADLAAIADALGDIQFEGDPRKSQNQTKGPTDGDPEDKSADA